MHLYLWNIAFSRLVLPALWSPLMAIVEVENKVKFVLCGADYLNYFPRKRIVHSNRIGSDGVTVPMSPLELLTTTHGQHLTVVFFHDL